MLLRKLFRKSNCPPAVPQRMHFHPNPVLRFAQFERAQTAWQVKVPMMAPGAPGQLPLASNDEAAPAALIEGLPCCEPETEFEHARL